MGFSKRFLWLLMSALLLGAVSSCAPSNQNGNQSATNTGAPQVKPGRWVEQWRSPLSKGAEGPLLGRYTYTCLSVVSPDVVFAGGDIPDPKGTAERVGIFVKTTDGGKNWTETTLERSDMRITTINAIQFLSPTTGWLAGVTAKMETVVLRTTDAGATWEASLVNVKQLPTTICFVDENKGWMGGTYPVSEDEDEDDEEIQNKPSDLMLTTDGGKTWVAQRRLPITVLDIFFVNKDTGWLTGYKGMIYKTTDGGSTWNQQRSELELGEGSSLALVGEGAKRFKLYGIHFSDADSGFAVAISADQKEGRVLGTTNGGEVWAKKLIGGDHGFRDVFSLSAQEAWVLSDYDRYIYHTVDGGKYWNSEPVTAEQNMTFFDIQGADSTHVWAAGAGGIFTRLAE